MPVSASMGDMTIADAFHSPTIRMLTELTEVRNMRFNSWQFGQDVTHHGSAEAIRRYVDSFPAENAYHTRSEVQAMMNDYNIALLLGAEIGQGLFS